jgi:hypothetical protein
MNLWWFRRPRPSPARRHPARPRPRGLWLEAIDERSVPSVFTVTSTLDSGPVRCARPSSIPTPGGSNTIAFNIPGAGAPHTISLRSGLPTVTVPVAIDGTTQPGFAGRPLIVIDGGGLSGDGLTIRVGSCTVRAPVIDNFPSGAAIDVRSSSGDLISGNFLGTDASGTSAVANLTGVYTGWRSSPRTPRWAGPAT